MDKPTAQAAIQAECACAQADFLDAFLEASDEAVAKALAVSEVAQIARLELRSRQMLQVKWAARATQASETAGRVVATGGTLKAAFGAADKVMARWKQDVTAPYLRNIGNAYKLARIAGHKRAIGKYKASLQYPAMERVTEKAKKKPFVSVSFDLVDEKAVKALQEQELMWIGGVYDGIAPTIREALDPALIAGLDRAAAGKLVADAIARSLEDVSVPDSFAGSSASYFEGLAANSMTTARVSGQLGSFSRLGIVRYEIVNPMDNRTTLLCQELNGTVFYVKDGMDQLADVQAASTPTQYKSAHPWLSLSQVKSLKSKGTKAMAAAGLSFPPYHWCCRSTVDVAESSTTLEEG